jgi:predicted alpha/beta-fold hydrolase
MSIDWMEGDMPEDTPIVIILHGITGGSKQLYVRHCVERLGLKGYRVGVLHNRGIEKTPLTTPLCYHLSPVEDLDFALKHVRAQFPKSKKVYGLGLSAGGNFALSYAGKYGKLC